MFMNEGKKSLVLEHKTGQNRCDSFLLSLLFYLFSPQNTITNEKGNFIMKTKFTKEVDTLDEFREVCWNCTKSYLGYFILLAVENKAPTDYIDIAYNAFLERFINVQGDLI